MLPARGFSGQFTIVVAAMLLLAASGLVWSQSRSTDPGVTTAMHLSAPAISPTDLMLAGGDKLPPESWDAF